MPGFDLPWRANQMDPVRQICEWKNYFRKSMLRKITPRARRMGGAQRYPSRRRVNMLACRMPDYHRNFTVGCGFFFERRGGVLPGGGVCKTSSPPTGSETGQHEQAP